MIRRYIFVFQSVVNYSSCELLSSLNLFSVCKNINIEKDEFGCATNRQEISLVKVTSILFCRTLFSPTQHSFAVHSCIQFQTFILVGCAFFCKNVQQQQQQWQLQQHRAWRHSISVSAFALKATWCVSILQVFFRRLGRQFLSKNESHFGWRDVAIFGDFIANNFLA